MQSLVLIPVNRKNITCGEDQVLACYFNADNTLISDRFYDSLRSFLRSQDLDASLLDASQSEEDSPTPGSLLAVWTSFGDFMRKRLLFAR